MAALVQFDSRGHWGETLVCEGPIRKFLQRRGIQLGAGTVPGKRAAPVRYVLDEPTLLYVATREGALGLLCEPGEWVAFPWGLPHFVDGAHHEVPAPPLPAQQEFVERLLALTGNALDEGA
jgi:hypothetical protein